MKFHVTYYYLATGMEGRANERDYGIVAAPTANEAIEQIIDQEYPKDEMYGPNDSYSTRDWMRSCLRAKPVRL